MNESDRQAEPSVAPGEDAIRWRRARFWLPILAMIVGLAVSEILIRLLFPQQLTPLNAWAECCGETASDVLLSDSVYGWIATPGHTGGYARNTRIEINSLGLRDREYAPRTGDEIRILSLGDSYAFGYGVELEHGYPKVLEARLRERFATADISVISGGFTGYNTHHTLLELARLRPLLKPDFVIATFVAGNDVAENAIFERQLQQRLQSPVGFVGRNSHLARLILRVSFGPRFFAENRNAANIRYTLDLLDDLDHQLARTALPYLIIIIPARHQVRPAVHPGAALVARLGADGYLFRHNDRVREHLQERGVRHVDTYQALAGRDSVELVYFQDDPHTNPLGHSIIAETVFDSIVPEIEKMLEHRSVGG